MIGKLVMELFHARTTAHVLHLKSRSYAQHVALQGFYDGVIPLADALAEAYQGEYSLIETYPTKYSPYSDPILLMAGMDHEAPPEHLARVIAELNAAEPKDAKAIAAATARVKALSGEKTAKDAVLSGKLSAALKAANYPAKADMAKFDKVTVVIILTYLVLLVTMVYGPIAAMLVEMFPTRIRYTSMSLPYHIGNGWFGGLLPTTAFAMVAATGDIYYGLWYPIVIALMTFVIGTLFLRDTKDVDIT